MMIVPAIGDQHILVSGSGAAQIVRIALGTQFSYSNRAVTLTVSQVDRLITTLGIVVREMES